MFRCQLDFKFDALNNPSLGKWFAGRSNRHSLPRHFGHPKVCGGGNRPRLCFCSLWRCQPGISVAIVQIGGTSKVTVVGRRYDDNYNSMEFRNSWILPLPRRTALGRRLRKRKLFSPGPSGYPSRDLRSGTTAACTKYILKGIPTDQAVWFMDHGPFCTYFAPAWLCKSFYPVHPYNYVLKLCHEAGKLPLLMPEQEVGAD